MLVTRGPRLRLEGKNLQSHLSSSKEGKGAGDFQPPMASDVIKHAYVTKPSQKPERMGFRELLSPFPQALPPCIFPLTAHGFYPFIINQ